MTVVPSVGRGRVLHVGEPADHHTDRAREAEHESLFSRRRVGRSHVSKREGTDHHLDHP